MADARQTKLDELLKKRDSLRDTVQRVKGRLDSARLELKAVEDECLQRKVAPDQLEDSIRRLDEKYTTVLADLQTKIQAAEQAVAPYSEEEV